MNEQQQIKFVVVTDANIKTFSETTKHFGNFFQNNFKFLDHRPKNRPYSPITAVGSMSKQRKIIKS